MSLGGWLGSILFMLIYRPIGGVLAGAIIGLLIRLVAGISKVVVSWEAVGIQVVPLWLFSSVAGFVIHFIILAFLDNQGTPPEEL